jgi:hypothetical protein
MAQNDPDQYNDNKRIQYRNPAFLVAGEVCCPETNEKLSEIVELLSKPCSYPAGLAGTSTTILGAVHNLGVSDLAFEYYTIGTGEQVADVSGFVATVNTITFDVVITSNAPMDGIKVIIYNPAC